MLRKLLLSGIAVAGFVTTACNKKDKKDNPVNETVILENKSVNPALAFMMPGFESVNVYTLISSDDVLPQSASFVYGAQPDGAGLLKDPNSDGYILLTNHEILRSVSRVFLDKTFKPVKGEYIVDGVGGVWRLCSATLATPAEHGFGPLFLTAGESGQESMVHGISPLALVSDRQRSDRVYPALGKASMENAVPLPKQAYAGKTIILIGEDQSWGTNHVSAGQLAMYMSNTVGDLNNGKFYALKRTSGDQTEMNMTVGNSYDVEFTEIPNAKNLTGAEINVEANTRGAIRFSRVEDVDYRKGSAANNREIYFVATGQSPNRVTPETGYTMWGRLYKLTMDATDPLKGKLEVVIDGDATPGTGIINPDNVCATENYVYVQEDGDSYYTAATHDSYIWQYNISSKQNKPFMNMNHKRGDAGWNTKYNQTGETRFGSWEWGAMWDISDIIGVPNTFLANIHPHTWQENKFLNADGSGTNTNKEGGQTIILRNVPR
jgi:hypothetical protein